MIADFFPWSNSGEQSLRESYLIVSDDGILVSIERTVLTLSEAQQLKTALESALNLLLCKQDAQNQG